MLTWGTVNCFPRCGLFAFGCLISARMPLSLQSGIAATKAGLSSDGVE